MEARMASRADVVSTVRKRSSADDAVVEANYDASDRLLDVAITVGGSRYGKITADQARSLAAALAGVLEPSP